MRPDHGTDELSRAIVSGRAQDLFGLAVFGDLPSGAAAAMDMMLHFITQITGRRIAAGVAEAFIDNRIRPASETQRMTPADRMDTRHPGLRRLLKFLDVRLDRRLNLDEMARSGGISVRESAGCSGISFRYRRSSIIASCGCGGRRT